jgi:hypothetical protein
MDLVACVQSSVIGNPRPFHARQLPRGRSVISYPLPFWLRPVDPAQLERKVPRGYGEVFVQAGRVYDLDPMLLVAISAIESGEWKSRAARTSQ